MQSKNTLIYETGIMKLADFGLSKTLPLDRHAHYELDSKFKLTGETGSYRYMAPEVFRHEPYNFKVRSSIRRQPDPVAAGGSVPRSCC